MWCCRPVPVQLRSPLPCAAPGLSGRVRVIPDERAAAFIGLGIAQATRRPVVLICTSGSAGLNYAPAVAEAYFQQVPLLVLTADRPPEWIDQLDGQTIRQRNLYGAHAKAAFDFPVDTTLPDAKWHSARIINEAINLAQAAPAGPVQVNVPLGSLFIRRRARKLGTRGRENYPATPSSGWLIRIALMARVCAAIAARQPSTGGGRSAATIQNASFDQSVWTFAAHLQCPDYRRSIS